MIYRRGIHGGNYKVQNSYKQYNYYRFEINQSIFIN